MNINLYKNTSENNCINKHITLVDSISAVIKGDISLTKPSLIVNYDSAYISNCNYAYIPEYSRYYYITNITNITGGRCIIDLSVDVLESFKNSILGLSAIIEKQENKGNLYFNDGSFNVLATEFLQTYNFPNGFDDSGKFILITCGG